MPDYVVNLKNPSDTPDQIAEKLNTLTYAIDAKVIRGFVPREEFDDLKGKTNKYISGNRDRINNNDLRYHGAGLSKVVTDGTLTGQGNVGSPLSVVALPGAGTVTSVSVATANGVSGSVATATTTPAITLTLGAITPTSTNGVTATTMAYMDATSSVQTQLNAKGAGTVTAVSVATANGVSGSSSGGATPALTIALGAITPTSVNGVAFSSAGATGVAFPQTNITVPPFNVDSATPLNSVYRLRFSDSNFISNSSFESWLSGTSVAPDAWTIQGTATVARNSTAYQGTYSAAVTYGAASDGEFYSVFGVNSNVDYTYTAYVTRISGTGNARFVAQQNFGSFTEDMSVPMSTASGQQLVALTFKPSLSGNYRVSFKATDSAGSVWRVDEVKVQESKYVATAWTPAFIDDSFAQNVYGSKTFYTTQTFANAVINTNNAIAASGNAATVPVTAKLNTVTNNSAATLTITMATSGAVDGQMTVVRILDFSAAAETLTLVNTENSTVTAPASTNGSTTLPLTLGFMFNSQTTKWRLIASA